MRSFLVFAVWAVCFCVAPSPVSASGGSVGAEPDSLRSAVEQAAQEYFAAAPQAVGLSVGVIAGGDVRTFHFGSVEPDGPAPDDQTVYAIGSITKTVTGTLLAQAALDGRLDLSADIRDYLDGSYPNLEYEGQPITPAHLVNHVSGLPAYLPDRPEMSPGFADYGEDAVAWVRAVKPVIDAYSRDDFFRDLRAVQLDTIPGIQFSYSNASAELAGFILERVYGRPYEVLVDSFITQPLGLASTSFEPGARVATGYDGTGRPMPRPPASRAAGGLWSTIDDLARYAQWHLDERAPVVQLSHTPPGGAPDDPAQGFAVGLSWQMVRSAGGIRRVSQDGNVVGFAARVVLYPELGLGVVVLANQLDRSIPPQTDQLADAVLEALDERTFTFLEGL